MTKKQDHRIAFELCNRFKLDTKSVCIIVEDNKEAKLLKNELDLYLNKFEIDYFPENEVLPYDHFSIPQNIIKERFRILNSEDNHNKILISTVKNLFEIYPTIDFFKSVNRFSIGDTLSISSLEGILSSLNYKKVNRIESINEYSFRGGIVDIYTPIYKNPLRIEIFDDKIESIRLFNPESQLSIETINHFNLSKGSIQSLDKNSLKIFKDNWREYFQDNDERYCEIFQKLNRNELVEGSEIYLPLFFNKTSDFFDLFKSYEFIKVSNFSILLKGYKEFIDERYSDENIDSQRPILKPSDMFTDVSLIKNKLKTASLLSISNKYEDFLYNNFDEIMNKKSINNINVKVFLTSINSQYESLLEKYLPDVKQINQIDNAEPGINIMMSPVIRPLIVDNILVAHREFFTNTSEEILHQTRHHHKVVDKDVMFKNGDLVIHENYGLGKYEGLEVVKANGISNEYIKIIYSSNESLYVPLRSVELVSKYHKNNIIDEVSLDSLSSTRWLKNKDKASKRAYDHAAEILDVESRRRASNSAVLKIDDKDFDEFNAEFPYKETPDQIEAVNSIKKDIGLIKPMNRVLCGDVGFGKTEVAMRAAYISVHSSKQVILLCPSTVLSDQHFESFLERYKKFPLNIKLLNRHSSAKDKVDIVKSFNTNDIDILIGTHALFTCGINFNNTGLLIVDEEHKFGIRQKDIIKSKQENIHILYLSATPIPRTMNFIFSGLKEFSFLHTPPTNRISIKSFLKVQSNQLIKEALSREISRGGQCFIVQNDISKMEMLKREINSLLPEVSIDIAHGKLKKQDISNVMTRFDTGDLEILICTTIVEMGLDIPNANTIIIIDAQNFGLSQLHQLRGRVGRSNKQGYCYFLIPVADLSKIAKERLDSIIRLSALGSGFFIAQEDLEIRGGGEMLGDKQSGHINSVGISLYLSMLKNALDKFKNNDEKELIQTEINFYDSSYISDKYLPSALERLKIYKSINKVTNNNELNEIKSNLIDRCGVLPDEVSNLISNAELGILIKNSGITKISSNNNKTSLVLSTDIKKEVFERILTLVTNKPNIYSINKDNKFVINIKENIASVRRRKTTELINEII